MSETLPEPPTSPPPPPPTPPVPPEPGTSAGSLAAGVGLAWVIMIVGEALAIGNTSISTVMGGILLPPLAILVCATALLFSGKPRTGKGMFLGLLTIVAVVLLLVAACFGLFANYH